ncbi:MAG: NnrS family protein [Verrucomicrobia bacterium]|nr:NnrS family protein [Verrucomicrobiota bacterium]
MRGRWASFTDLHREPFRIFFPAATLAGFIGVALWPVVLLGWTQNYPGPSHARLMVQGFFGGYILGFMGTAMPRLVGGRPFSAFEAFSLFALFLGNVAANTFGMNTLADWLFAGELVFLSSLLKRRRHSGGDLPPPGFLLVGLSFASALAGVALHLAGRRWELSQTLGLLARLLSYHGFVLLAVMGAGGFLLPRFLGLGARRRFPETTEVTPEWKRGARIAKTAGALVLLTYPLEATGWSRVAGVVRALTIVAYLAYEMPLERLRWHWRGVQWQLIVGLVCVPLGVLAAGWFPAMRQTMSHLELIGGFALITLGVGTRVVFGHSGALERLERFHPGLAAAALLMLVGLVSRISGDFAPGIQATHYLYGAGCWILGVVVWAVCVLPRAPRPDPES